MRMRIVVEGRRNRKIAHPKTRKDLLHEKNCLGKRDRAGRQAKHEEIKMTRAVIRERMEQIKRLKQRLKFQEKPRRDPTAPNRMIPRALCAALRCALPCCCDCGQGSA